PRAGRRSRLRAADAARAAGAGRAGPRRLDLAVGARAAALPPRLARRAAEDPPRARPLGRVARRDLCRCAAGAGPVAAGDRPLLGRLRQAGAQPAQRRGERRGRRLHGAHGAARRAKRLRPAPPDPAAGRDARRRCRPRARGGRRDGAPECPGREPRRARGRRPRGRGAAARERPAARRAGAAAGGLADRQRPPLVRPPAARLAARRAARQRRALGLRPRRADRLAAGAGPVPDRRLVRRARADGAPRPRARRADRLGADRPSRRRGAALVTGQPRAGSDDRGSARQRGGAPGPADGKVERHARGRVDRHRLARDDGGRDPQRPRRCPGAYGPAPGGRRVSVATETRLDAAIEAATGRLLELQHPDGYWVGELESNVTMTAQHLFWHHVLGLRTPELDRKIANELLARQRADGTWAICLGGPGDLATTIEAYAALKLAGVDPGAKAREVIRSRGGIPKTRIFTKCFLALLGQWPWQRVTPIPVELVLFPPGAPFSIYNFSCWARGTFVPLAACRALRPVRHAGVDLREIGSRPGRTRRPAPPGPMRRAALREAERWVRAHQEADGSWGGIQPPWVWSILMLAALGHGFEDETFRRAVEGWEGFMVDDGDRLRPEACQSPVWDTGLAVLALRDSGLGPEHPALVKAADWLLSEEVTVAGDWAVRKPDLAPGGWAFEFQNDLYPDVDDTAVVALALRRCHRGHDAVDRGLRWTAGMQSRSGGWGAFDVDNEAFWLYKLPFCDFGKVTDEPSADVTAHALEALAPESGYD